jgi:hypothetical protein
LFSFSNVYLGGLREPPETVQLLGSPMASTFKIRDDVAH